MCHQIRAITVLWEANNMKKIKTWKKTVKAENQSCIKYQMWWQALRYQINYSIEKKIDNILRQKQTSNFTMMKTEIWAM